MTSDDFDDAVLAGIWSVEGPSGTSASLEVSGDEKYLVLTTQPGNHDIWTQNKSARALQQVADGDFEVAARFLSTPSAKYQMQGILVEEDADSWIRFDTYSNGSTLYAFAAVTLDGAASTKINVAIPGGSAPYLRVTRAGDSWTLAYSVDGASWTVAGSFTQAMTVTALGPFAASTGAAPGFTAQVDYFFDTAAIPATEDGQSLNGAPVPQDDALATGPDTAITFSEADLLANDADPNGDALSITAIDPPASGALQDNGDGTWTYTPAQGFTGTDSFTYTVSDGAETATATVSVDVSPPPGPPASDDFDDALLAGIWSVEGPSGTSASLEVSGDEKYLVLTTQPGNHDIWTQNKSARALQQVADGDFEVAARFLSTPSAKYQMQGILVEEDADSWIRFDTYSNGSTLYAFAAVTLDGAASTKINVAIPGGSAPYLRVTRAGDSWTLAYSVDGASWTVAGSFTQAMTVTALGPFAASTGAAPGFTAQVDYFFDTAAIPATEDGQSLNGAPVPQDDALATGPDTAITFSEADLLANDADPNGDALSITAIDPPASGALQDNGDGTWTYTPAQGFTGTDSFTYTVSDGAETATATVSVDVSPPPGPPASDDFDDALLAGIWSVEGPSGTSASLEVSGDEKYLVLTTQPGNHDIWTQNKSARALQQVADGDFEVAARFLSTPSAKYQMQGILVEEDADSWIRFDTYSNGSTLYAFAAVTLDGAASTKINVAIPGGSAPYLRVTRAGDSWTLAYSVDGASWTVAGSFTQAMTVTALGPFAASTGAAPGFTAQVDYFFDTAAIPATEDGQSLNGAPVPQDDALATGPDTAITFSEADLLANDADPNGDALSITAIDPPASGALQDNGDGTWTYTPAQGFTGTDSFTYTVSDGAETATATVSVDVSPPPGPPASDDFDDALLAGIWSVEGPSGTSASLEVSGDEKYLVLTTQPGNHDIWTQNKSARALQQVADGDFEVAARFLSTPSAKYQMQGILVEEDADSWIRFDTYSNGSTLYAFAAVTLDGAASTKINVAIPGGSAPYLRVTRAGDSWTLAYSVDGASWTVAGSFTQAMTVTALGPFAASTGAAPGFTAQVDYFFDTAAIPATEDGQSLNGAPVPQDDALATGPDTAITFSEADLLANDADPNGDALSITAIDPPASGALQDNGDGTWTYTPAQGFTGTDSFTYTVSDGAETATATVSVDVSPPPGPPASDDFDDALLAGIWSVEGPSGTSASLEVSGDEKYLVLTTQPGNHDIWTQNKSARALQQVADGDFEVAARFLSTPSAKYQMQGILVEEDADSWIRFDTYSNGSTLYAFAAVTLDGAASTKINVAIPGGSAPYLRVTRAGDSWTLAYSVDGASWTVAGSFTQAMTVTALGPFAASTGAAPGFTAQVDYFFDTAAIPATEDGQSLNGAPVPQDDALATGPDTAITFSEADLLANDADPNGDALSITAIDPPASGALQDNGDGTWTYTPAQGFTGTDSFTYTVSDGAETATATVSVDVSPPPGPPASDDFSGADTDAQWRFEAVAGSASLAQSDGEGYLALTVPAGSHDIWNTNNAARYLQDIADIDFDIEVKFLSTPTARTQMQGILVEEDAQNWIRFDTLHNGTEVQAFAAVTVNGSSQKISSVGISAENARYLRVVRSGDNWTFQNSADGETWATSASFTHVINVASIGPFAAIAHSAPGFEVQVDYLKLTGELLADDASIPRAPEPADDMLATAADTALLIDVDADLLANDIDQNGDTLSFAGFAAPTIGTLVDNGDGTLTYTPPAGRTGVATFTYDISDGALTATGTVTVEIDNAAPAPADDVVSATEDTAILVDFLANDTDPDGDTLTISSIGAAANGTVTDNGDGTVTYTPDADYSGTDQFTYQVTDGAKSSQATVSLSVAPVDDAPRPSDDTAFTLPGAPIVIEVDDLLANDVEVDGQTLQLSGFAQPLNGTLVDNNDGTLTYTPNTQFTGVDSFTYTVSDGALTGTANVNVTVSEVIDVWYGDVQKFGNLGETQEWVNILGNLALPGITDLSYTLNGGASRSLVIGGDGRRLEKDGDFNIEIAYSELDATAADDVIEITAMHQDGTTYSRSVTIDYQSGNDWSPNYSIDWESVTDVQDVLQVVDGKWSWDAGGITPEVQGYDRLLALGDDSWDNYEVNLTVTMNDLQTASSRHGGLFAIGMLWNGHTDTPVEGYDPHAGWENSAGFYFWGEELVQYDRYHGWSGARLPLHTREEGLTYNVTLRLEQVDIMDRRYSLKIWEEGEQEPVDWLIVKTERFDAPATGSLVLNSHYHSVTFGNIDVTEILGSDIIAARDTGDVIDAATPALALPGQNEVDVLQGGLGADIFVLGDASQVYYNDGVAGTVGQFDFAMIWDFETGVDRIQLHGDTSMYTVGAAPTTVYNGGAIYLNDPEGDDELIAVLNGTVPTIDQFDFV